MELGNYDQAVIMNTKSVEYKKKEMPVNFDELRDQFITLANSQSANE